MNQTTSPKSLPEDKDMDPVGEPYPKQRESTVPTIPEDGNDSLTLRFQQTGALLPQTVGL